MAPGSQIEHLCEPSARDIFETLLPRYVEVQILPRASWSRTRHFSQPEMTAMDTRGQECDGHDREPDALHEQGAPGGHHAEIIEVVSRSGSPVAPPFHRNTQWLRRDPERSFK